MISGARTVFADKHESSEILTQQDISDIRLTGRNPAHVIHQVETLKGKRKSPALLRPATINDGIQQLQTYDPAALFGLHEKAAAAGRVSAFVPASGSGTRLFHSLLQLYRDGETDVKRLRQRASEGDADVRDALVVLENITDFAIWEELQKRRCSPDSYGQLLQTLFGEEGLQYHELPKGLIPFHRYDGFVRTAFVEHVHEAAVLATDRTKTCRIHFTVTPSHQPRFEEEYSRERPELERALGVRFQIDFSAQSPATDTIAIDLQGNIRRDDEGRITFQPGGHGALLDNLNMSGGDIVLIKNIDNVVRQEHSIEIAQIRKQISGLLLSIESQVHDAIRNLRKGHGAGEALQLLERQFGRRSSTPLSSEAAQREYAMTQLNRPIRVCGVVSTTDHTGGRPFWIDVEDFGPSLQLVESAEVDLTNPQEKNLFHLSSHFNPVEIACSLRDVDGRPFDLNLFTSPDRALIAKKTLNGVPSLLYEHPGLWNGLMALWNTVFVEIPDFAFNPVKSLSDLLNPRHLGEH
jgi:hypothetical protein